MEIQKEFDTARGFYNFFEGCEELYPVAIAKELGELLNILWKIFREIRWRGVPRAAAWHKYAEDVAEEAADVAAYIFKVLYKHYSPPYPITKVQLPEREEEILLTFFGLFKLLYNINKEKLLKILAFLDALCSRVGIPLERAYTEKVARNYERFRI